MILGTKSKKLIRNDLHLPHFGVKGGGLFKDPLSRNNENLQSKITEPQTLSL